MVRKVAFITALILLATPPVLADEQKPVSKTNSFGAPYFAEIEPRGFQDPGAEATSFSDAAAFADIAPAAGDEDAPETLPKSNAQQELDIDNTAPFDAGLFE